MPFYKKKPVVIEAYQITYENAEELAIWSNSEVTRRPDGTISGMLTWTLEGQMTGAIGDYLIKGIRDEFYFCRLDIFEDSYTRVLDSRELINSKYSVKDKLNEL